MIPAAIIEESLFLTQCFTLYFNPLMDGCATMIKPMTEVISAATIIRITEPLSAASAIYK